MVAVTGNHEWLERTMTVFALGPMLGLGAALIAILTIVSFSILADRETRRALRAPVF